MEVPEDVIGKVCEAFAHAYKRDWGHPHDARIAVGMRAALKVLSASGFRICAESKSDVRNEALEEAAQAADKFADDHVSAMKHKKKRYADYEVENMINAHLKGAARLVAEDIRSLKNAPEQTKASLPEIQTTIPEGWKMVRNAALEDAAKICEQVREGMIGDASCHNIPDAETECAMHIRALKT